MKRVVSIALLALAACVGCAEETPEPELTDQLHQLWIWPDDAGPSRDLQADHLVCEKKIGRKAGFPETLRRRAACMRAKGWVLHQPADRES